MTAGSTLEALPADPILERREYIQHVARRSLGRRNAYSAIMLGVCALAFLAAGALLVWILYLLIHNGLQWWSREFFTQNPQTPTIFHPNNVGGIKNAIVGSIVIDALAVAIAVPFGILGGLLLAESDNPLVNAIARITEVLIGLPSILFGVFVFSILILRYHEHFAGWLGSIALAILMIPVIMKASEVAFRTVPHSLKEAGLSLGLSKGKVSRRIVVPFATPGLLTAVLLATSRAVGETAPLLLVIGNNYAATWSLTKQQTTVPYSIWYNFLNPISPAQLQSAWGAALFLVVVVLLLNLASRLTAAWLRRERR